MKLLLATGRVALTQRIGNRNGNAQVRPRLVDLEQTLAQGRSFSGRERNCCFLNLGEGQFADISAAASLDLIHDGRAVAVTDWDFDGNLDFWITSRTGPRVRFLRNDRDDSNNFVAFRLQGTDCNRDAIGARVVLYRTPDDQRPLIRTLYAGHGYLAQSSKWLHFGLGEQGQIDRVVVRWPGVGGGQTVQNLKPNRHYRITQGAAEAEWAKIEPPSSRLVPTTPQEGVGTDQARVVILQPARLPNVHYIDEKGVQQSIASQTGKPLLVNFWGTWCLPCLAELKEWAKHERELRNAGISVLALCVDEPTADEDVLSKSADIAKRCGYPFELGLASKETIQLFDIVQRTFIGKQRPMPIPASFLIDANGHVVVIYRGPVTPARLLEDCRLLEAPRQEVLAAAVPFGGRWLNPPDPTPASAVARTMINDGEFDAAHAYLNQLVDSYQQQLPSQSGKEQAELRTSLASALETMGRLRFDRKDYQGALAAYHRSLDAVPHRRGVLTELVHTYSALHQPRKVAEQLIELLKIRPDDPENLIRLAMLKASFGDIDQAAALAQEAVALRSTAQHHALLARFLLAKGDGAAAIAEFRNALSMRPEWTSAQNDLAWTLATHADDEIRDGAAAVELAEAVNVRTDRSRPGYLDTLAAAYAESGRFQEAVDTSNQAIALAQSSGNGRLAEKIRDRLDFYANGLPYRDTPSK